MATIIFFILMCFFTHWCVSKNSACFHSYQILLFCQSQLHLTVLWPQCSDASGMIIVDSHRIPQIHLLVRTIHYYSLY